MDVQIPPTRADILHQCDLMEDVAVAYGFNNLPKPFPGKSGTIAQPLMVNKLGDIVRLEAAMAGWSEVMPLILCSHDENFAWLNRKDDGKTAVRLANPKTAEYQVIRTSLLPGLLKTIRENKHHSMPIKVFEVSDVAFKDLSLERKSRNERHLAAAWCGKSSGFEVVHGLLDRIMMMLKSAFVTHEEGLEGKTVDGYWIEEVAGMRPAQAAPLLFCQACLMMRGQMLPFSRVTRQQFTFEWVAGRESLACLAFYIPACSTSLRSGTSAPTT